MASELDAVLGGQSAPVETPAATPAADTPAPTTISPAVTPEAGKPVAPAPGQVAAKPEAEAKPASAAPEGQAAPVVSDEQLLNAAGLTESPDKKVGRLERDHAASSKEARRLLDENKSLKDILNDQGADIARDEQGKIVGLVATKKYTKDAATLDLKFADLPENVQALAEADPQKFMEAIVQKAKLALTRVTPTIEKNTVALSPERHEAAVSYLEGMKTESGDLKFPGLAANRKLIEQTLNAPSASKALKEFYNQEPEEAIALLHLRFEAARAYIAGQSEKAAAAIAAKRKAADTTLQPVSSGGGVPTAGDGADSDIGNQVAHARMKY